MTVDTFIAVGVVIAPYAAGLTIIVLALDAWFARHEQPTNHTERRNHS